jgi:hypothetical protein
MRPEGDALSRLLDATPQADLPLHERLARVKAQLLPAGDVAAPQPSPVYGAARAQLRLKLLLGSALVVLGSVTFAVLRPVTPSEPPVRPSAPAPPSAAAAEPGPALPAPARPSAEPTRARAALGEPGTRAAAGRPRAPRSERRSRWCSPPRVEPAPIDTPASERAAAHGPPWPRTTVACRRRESSSRASRSCTRTVGSSPSAGVCFVIVASAPPPCRQ